MLHRQPKPDLQVRKAARRQSLDLCPQGKTPSYLLGSLLKEAELSLRIRRLDVSIRYQTSRRTSYPSGACQELLCI